MKFATYAAVAAGLAATADALPAMRTYRGKSPYEAVREPASAVEAHSADLRIPNPRVDPDFFAHRRTAAYASQGFGAERRPAWAQAALERAASSLEKLERLAEHVGLDVWRLAKLASPYWNGRGRGGLTLSDHLYGGAAAASQRKAGGSRFRFNPEGDADFERVREGQSRKHWSNGTFQDNFDPNLPIDAGFDYRNAKVRGVNLGNWLVAEFWMDAGYGQALNQHAINAPYPNPIVDEWTVGLYSDPGYAEQVQKGHYESWINEADFAAIANAGLNHVRIPFPYWAFAEAKGPEAPYFTWNQYDKLIQAVGWAKKYNLKVWVDLHCVPGSQNGFDNSGHTGPIDWPNNPSYYSQTQYAFQRLVSTFATPNWNGVVTAIEPVNEPQGSNQAVLDLIYGQYYPWALNAVSHVDGNPALTPTLLAMHDGFKGPDFWAGFFTGASAARTVLDLHLYYVYDPADKAAKDSVRLRKVCSQRDQIVRSMNNYPTVVGEMAPNGPNGDNNNDRDLGDGPIAFPPGPAYPYSAAYMGFLARNFRTQQNVFESGAGWIFWAWRNEAAPDWSYKTGMQFGWLPNNADGLNNNPFGSGICNI